MFSQNRNARKVKKKNIKISSASLAVIKLLNKVFLNVTKPHELDSSSL